MKKNRRRKSPRDGEYQELDVSRLKMSIPHIEQKRGGEFQVQQTNGASAEEGKSWICPVCVVTIAPGTIHTVAWDVHRGVQTRRHFHNHCWRIFDGILP
jgi:hypothetical protein